MKYKVFNTDEHLGDACPEYYETYEEACVAQEKITSALFDLFKEECLKRFREEIFDSILIEEIE